MNFNLQFAGVGYASVLLALVVCAPARGRRCSPRRAREISKPLNTTVFMKSGDNFAANFIW
jgi:hypothetical protein